MLVQLLHGFCVICFTSDAGDVRRSLQRATIRALLPTLIDAARQLGPKRVDECLIAIWQRCRSLTISQTNTNIGTTAVERTRVAIKLCHLVATRTVPYRVSFTDRRSVNIKARTHAFAVNQAHAWRAS